MFDETIHQSTKLSSCEAPDEPCESVRWGADGCTALVVEFWEGFPGKVLCWFPEGLWGGSEMGSEVVWKKRASERYC